MINGNDSQERLRAMFAYEDSGTLRRLALTHPRHAPYPWHRDPHGYFRCDLGRGTTRLSLPRHRAVFPGDLTICIRCGTVHRFDPELRLKVATREEIEQLPQSTLEELAEQQARFKAFHGLAPVISLPPRKSNG